MWLMHVGPTKCHYYKNILTSMDQITKKIASISQSLEELMRAYYFTNRMSTRDILFLPQPHVIAFEFKIFFLVFLDLDRDSTTGFWGSISFLMALWGKRGGDVGDGIWILGV